MSDNLDLLEDIDPEEEKLILSDILDRVLTKGVVITGDITLGIADVDLIYCSVRILLSSVDTLED